MKIKRSMGALFIICLFLCLPSLSLAEDSVVLNLKNAMEKSYIDKSTFDKEYVMKASQENAYLEYGVNVNVEGEYQIDFEVIPALDSRTYFRVYLDDNRILSSSAYSSEDDTEADLGFESHSKKFDMQRGKHTLKFEISEIDGMLSEIGLKFVDYDKKGILLPAEIDIGKNDENYEVKKYNPISVFDAEIYQKYEIAVLRTGDYNIALKGNFNQAQGDDNIGGIFNVNDYDSKKYESEREEFEEEINKRKDEIDNKIDYTKYDSKFIIEEEAGTRIKLFIDGVEYKDEFTTLVKNETIMVLKLSLSKGTHKFEFKHANGNYELKSCAVQYSGNEKAKHSYTFDPGNYANYIFHVEESGKYRVNIEGVFRASQNAMDILIDGKIKDSILIKNTESKGSVEIIVEKGTHTLELNAYIGHFILDKLEVERVKVESINAVDVLTSEEFNKQEEETVFIRTGLVEEKEEEEKNQVFPTENVQKNYDDALARTENEQGGLAATFFKLLAKLLQPVVSFFIALLTKFLVQGENGIISRMFELAIDFLTWRLQIWLFEGLLFALRICDALMSVISIFAGTKEVVAYGQPVILINMIFNTPIIRRVFWSIFIIGIILSVFFSIVAVIRASVTEDEERNLPQTLKTIGKSLVTYALVPIIVILGINLSSMVLKQIDEVIISAAGGKDITLGNSMFMLLSFGQETDKYEYCSNNPNFTDDARAPFYNNNNKYERSANSIDYFDFSFLRIVCGLAITLFILCMLIITTLMFVVRIFELLLLFIVSPYFAASISLDGGEKFKRWRDTFIAKLISGFGIVIMMRVYINIVLPIILSGNIQFSSITLYNLGITMLLMVGGCFAVYKSHTLIMQVVNPQLALTENGVMGAATMAVEQAKNIARQAAGDSSVGKVPGGGGGLSVQEKNLASGK